MSDSRLSAILARLSALAPETQLEDVLSSIVTPEPAGFAEAKKRCSLVRWFDSPLYGFLCADLDPLPDFEAFVKIGAVESFAPGKWAIETDERARLLAAWQSDQSAWREWNKKLGEYFAAQSGAEAQLGAVYHLAASPSPADVIPLFQQWFDRANDNFEMAHCNALLEMLRLQESWREPAVSRLWLDSHQYYSARMLFLDDYYKTGAYFERPTLLNEFVSVLDRTRNDAWWIFHVHATDGTGKTMFLRWLIARYLVPKKIMCARFDFDNFRLDEIVDFPLRLFQRMVEQLIQQPQGLALSALLERLRREELTTGWNPDVMAEIQRQLRGSGITTQVVVMLDTLEEATLSAAQWLERCVSSLREIHTVWPNLTLVLSGRYDIAQRSNALLPGEFLPYELPRFSEREAHQYLQSRGIPPGPVRDAIVVRTEADEEPDDESGPHDTKLSGRNPFKLAMFAELALNRAKLTPDEVMRFPRADIAYLIERVIKRIEAQPLRWMIRYGAIARHLTIEFAEAVLLPPLLQALRGENDDEPGKNLDDENKDVWRPDAGAVAELEQKGVADLWEKLSAYARDRGWLTSIVVDGQTELRFHPEVINPTRELLRAQSIFAELQQRAAAFFEQKAESEERATAAVRYSCEAVFHRFQADGISAESYWIEQVRQAERFGAAAAVPVATEVTLREYAEAERIPYPRVSSPDILLRAHYEAADLLMQAAGLAFASQKNWSDFRRHMDLALQIRGESPDLPGEIPNFLQEILMAWRLSSPADIAERLRAAIPHVRNTREQFFLELQLGQALLKQPSSEAPVHLREALRLLEYTERTGVAAIDIHLELANYYEFQGIHTAVIEAQKAAAQSTGAAEPGGRARVLNREAWYALTVGDISTAESRVVEMRQLPIEAHPSRVSLQLLEARLALASLDPFTAIQATERGLAFATTESDRARCLDQQGEARALLFEFRAALNDWDSAATKYDFAAVPAGQARCALLAVRLKARLMGDYRDADTRISAALALRGSEDIEIRTELGLSRAFVLCRTGRREQASAILTALTGRADIPPRIHARVLMFALVFGLRKAASDLLEDIEETVSQMQPVSLRDSVLDWVEYADERIDVPDDFVRRLMGHLARPSFESSRGTELLIQRADLYRAFGRIKEAEAELARARDSRLLGAWRLNLARQRLGQPTQCMTLVEHFRDSEFFATPLYRALECAAASEALQNDNVSAAVNLLDTGRTRQADELPNVWQARRLDLLAEVVPPSEREALRREAAERYEALGQTPQVAAPEGHTVAVSESDLPPTLSLAASSLEFTMDVLFDNWALFAGELRSVLRSRKAEHTPIEPIGRVAALPWELAGALCRQSSKVPPRTYVSEHQQRPFAIRLLVPAHGEEEVSFGTGSGSRLEDVYHRNGIRPAVVEDMRADALFKELISGPPPVLLHIVAAVRDASGGTYLDFASTVHRVGTFGAPGVSFASSSFLPESSMTASHLNSILNGLPQPPFVILDIGRPYNMVEAVRMLLLRNLFATELFELGHARGVLACGLAHSNERLAMSSLVVEGLLRGSLTSPLRRLRSDPPGDLEHILPRHATALWTNNPEDRLFTV